MPKRVFVVGGVSWDTIVDVHEFPPPVPATVFSKGARETVGSTGAGKALNFNRLGFETTFHAMIGNDDPGRAIQAAFTAENLEFLHDVDPHGTERHTNLIDAEGRRISIYTHYATFEPDVDLGRLESLVAQNDYLALNISNYCRRLIPVAKRLGKEIWCDIHDYDGENEYHRDFIDAADYVLLSNDSMPDYRPFMEQLITAGKKLVVCTRGRDGAVALASDGEWIETPAVTSYKYCDSNGAGDSFFAGLVFGHSRGYSIERSMQMGAIVAGLCITSPELFHPELSVALVEAEYVRIFGDTGKHGLSE